MYCKFCGGKIPDDSTFCSACGQNQGSSMKDVPLSPGTTDAHAPSNFSKVKKQAHKILRSKWAWIVTAFILVAIGLTIGITLMLHKSPSTSQPKPVTVRSSAGTSIKTSFGLEYNIIHCGFSGSNLKVCMNVTNNTKMPYKILSTDWDDTVILKNTNSKDMYSYDDSLTSNYRMYTARNSLFATSIEETLQPGKTYEYDVIFAVSEKNANVSDYYFSAPPFGPGESMAKYSHLYIFNLKYLA